PDARDADEVHDALLTLGVLPDADVGAWREWIDALIAKGRAVAVRQSSDRGHFAAAERAAVIRVAYPDAGIEPPLLPLAFSEREAALDTQAAFLAIVRGWMDSIGPTTAAALAQRLGLPEPAVDGALLQLEADGCVLRGHFTADGGDGLEWCERGLLSRIHRLTIGRLRREIEAVSPADFV